MSENNSVRTIEINNAIEFRKFAKEFGIEVQDKGRLPKRALLEAILRLAFQGDVKFTETPFFSLAAMNGTTSARDQEIIYKITYHTLNKNGKPMPPVTITLTQNEIKSYVPNVKGMINYAMATMVVALHRSKDDSLLADLNKYVVTGLVKLGAAPGTDIADVTSEGEDTEETVTDADSDSETPTDAVVVNAGELVSA